MSHSYQPDMRTCPRCHQVEDLRFPALSRADNRTEICPPCGTEEALEAFLSPTGVTPAEEWPTGRRSVEGVGINPAG